MRSYTLRDSGTVRIFTSSTAERSPFPSRGRTIAPPKMRRDLQQQACVAIADLIHASRKCAHRVGSEAPDCRRDHLIHRKRSPFPYEGKDLSAAQ